MTPRRRHRHTLLLLALAVGMFGFAFALVPLYDVFCEITGLNGKTAERAAVIETPVLPVDRQVRVGFLARTGRGTPWEFRPLRPALTVRPGELHHATFYVRNHAATAVTAQAVPSVSPGQAAQYLKKLECFCFEQQHLPAGGEAEIGVSFMLEPELPDDINELTLAYTMFVVEGPQQAALQQ